MTNSRPDASRRRFLTGLGGAVTGLSGLRSTVDTARAAEPTRPAEYRWDLRPERDEERRNELSEYVDEVRPLVEDHPAFAYGTDRSDDDHGIDFAALNLFRERNFEQYAESVDVKEFVEAFDDDSYEDAKTDQFFYMASDGPREWDARAWREADSFGESLDYAHGLLLSLDYAIEGRRFGSFTAVLREAYQRYHPTYEPLAWTFRMDSEIRTRQRAEGWIGLVYSPTDDELRTFGFETSSWFGSDETRGLHTPIEDWAPIADPDGDPSGYRNPNALSHPLLFHTEGWTRGWSFPAAKTRAVEMVSHIASDPVRAHHDREGRVAITTGLLAQLTRTLLTYNDNGAEFAHLRQLANVMELVRDRGGSYVVDAVPEGSGYGGVFEGGFAVYEVGYDYVPGLVSRDAERQFDEFGDVYGLGAGASERLDGASTREEGS